MTHPTFDIHFPGVDDESMGAFRAYKRSMMLHRRLMMAAFSASDMHPAQAGCLQALAHHDGIGQSEIAEMLHVSRPTVTTMLQRMEAAGTIERRADESDSRITRVYLTDEGRRVAEGLRAGFADMLNLSIGSLPEGDRRELARLLDAMSDRIAAALQERGLSTHGHPHGHGGSDDR